MSIKEGNLRDQREIGTNTSVYTSEETITDSFPLMIIIMTFFVITAFHLFIHPNAKAFANFFAF